MDLQDVGWAMNWSSWLRIVTGGGPL
jgi:hypothetical protein